MFIKTVFTIGSVFLTPVVVKKYLIKLQAGFRITAPSVYTIYLPLSSQGTVLGNAR